MGLDSIWKTPTGEHPALSIRVCGGMFSGPGPETCTSFRGKVYADFIEALSGVSLYEESITGPRIKQILTGLVEFKNMIDNTSPGYKRLAFAAEKLKGVPQTYLEENIGGLDDLVTMFSAYAEIDGVELVSWY